MHEVCDSCKSETIVALLEPHIPPILGQERFDLQEGKGGHILCLCASRDLVKVQGTKP